MACGGLGTAAPILAFSLEDTPQLAAGLFNSSTVLCGCPDPRGAAHCLGSQACSHCAPNIAVRRALEGIFQCRFRRLAAGVVLDPMVFLRRASRESQGVVQVARCAYGSTCGFAPLEKVGLFYHA